MKDAFDYRFLAALPKEKYIENIEPPVAKVSNCFFCGDTAVLHLFMKMNQTLYFFCRSICFYESESMRNYSVANNDQKIPKSCM